MRSLRAGVDLRVLSTFVALVALGCTGMGVVLSAGFHAVRAQRPRVVGAHAPGGAGGVGDGAVVVSPPAAHHRALRAQRLAEGATFAPPYLPVAARPVAPPARAAAAAPAAAPSTPPAAAPSGLDQGGGLQPAGSGGPTTAGHPDCGSDHQSSGHASTNTKQAPALALRTATLPAAVVTPATVALDVAHHPDPQETAQPDGRSSEDSSAARPRKSGSDDDAGCADKDDDDAADGSDASSDDQGDAGDTADLGASGVTVTAATALDPLAAAPLRGA